jgi:hypothetical protein
MPNACKIRVTLATFEEAERFVSEVWMLLLEQDLPTPTLSVLSMPARPLALSLAFERAADAQKVAGSLDQTRYPTAQVSER